MSKKKDVHITNNISIKLDGDKNKKKKRKRKGKNYKKSRPYTQYPQYPNSGTIISSGTGYQQQPQIIRPELDYKKLAKNYLSIKDKDEEPITESLLIKDSGKTPIKKPKMLKSSLDDTLKSSLGDTLKKSKSLSSSTAKKLLYKKEYNPKVYKPKIPQAVILDYENLMNKKKHKTIKALKELMIAHGAPEDQFKKFTKESQRDEAVKLFLSKLEPIKENPKPKPKAKPKESEDTIYENKKVFTTSSTVKPPSGFINPLKRSNKQDNLENQTQLFTQEQTQDNPIDQTATSGDDYTYPELDLPKLSFSPNTTYQPKVMHSQFQDMSAYSPAGGGGQKGSLLASIDQQQKADEYDPYSTFSSYKDKDEISIRSPVRTSRETPLTEKKFTRYVRATSPSVVRPPFKPASAPAKIASSVMMPVVPQEQPLNISPRPRGRPKKDS